MPSTIETPPPRSIFDLNLEQRIGDTKESRPTYEPTGKAAERVPTVTPSVRIKTKHPTMKTKKMKKVDLIQDLSGERRRRKRNPLQLHASDETLGRLEIILYYCREEHMAKTKSIAWMLELYVRYLNRRFKRRREKKFYLMERVLDRKHLVDELDMGFRAFFIAGQRTGSKCLQGELSETEKRVHDKMIVVSDAGEAGTTGDYICTYIDLFFDRSRARVDAANARPECRAVHYLQGLMYLRLKQRSYELLELCKPRTEDKLLKRRKEDRPGDVIFAATRLVKRSFHDFDALIRCAFFYLLKERFPELAIDGTRGIVNEAAGDKNWTTVLCQGTHLDMSRCKRRYKFSMDMENFSDEGYVTEKIFTGLLANTVPIYFGAPDIGRYINPKRILICSIPKARIHELRKMKGTDDFNVNGLRMNSSNYDPPRLLAAAAAAMKEDLEPCIKQFWALFNNPTKYYSMLAEHPFTRQEAMCSTSPILYGEFGQDMHEALLDIDIKKHNGIPRGEPFRQVPTA